MSRTFDEEATVVTVLSTLPYIIDSGETALIGKTVAEITDILADRFKDNETVNDDMGELAAVRACIRRHPEIGRIKLEATSGKYMSPKVTINNLGEIVETHDDTKVRDYNSGVNTFRFWDEKEQVVYNSERGTSRGEWGFDNYDILNTAITGQNFQAIDVRKRFDNDPEVPKHENAVKKEIGQSKGGHKAIVCYLYDLVTKINDICADSKSKSEQDENKVKTDEEKKEEKREKLNRVQKLLSHTECYCLEAPFLSNEAMKFFTNLLEPSVGVIGDPLNFIRREITPCVHLMNLEDDYVSAINEENAFGILHLFERTHEDIPNAHNIVSLYGVEEDENGKLHFDGELTPKKGATRILVDGLSDRNPEQRDIYRNAWGDVHKAVAAFLHTADELPKDVREMALRNVLVKIDGFLNKTDSDVVGAKYYGSNSIDDASILKRIEKQEGKSLGKLLVRALSKREVRRLISKFIHDKTKKVEDDVIRASLNEHLSENAVDNNVVQPVYDGVKMDSKQTLSDNEGNKVTNKLHGQKIGPLQRSKQNSSEKTTEQVTERK